MPGRWLSAARAKSCSHGSLNPLPVIAFATALALSRMMSRGKFAFFAVAIIVAAERVLEGSHFVSDVLLAAGIGILCAHTVSWIFGPPLACDLEAPKPVQNPASAAVHAREVTGAPP